MLNSSGPCRLCLKLLKCDQTLYDECGRRTYAYELVAKYITPELLDMECAKHLTSICVKCWLLINEFHTFQQCVLLNQRKLAVLKPKVDIPTNSQQEVLLRTKAISPSAGSQVAGWESGRRCDSNSTIAAATDQHCRNISVEGFDFEKSISVDSTPFQNAEIPHYNNKPSGGRLGSSSLTCDRNNLEFVAGHEDGMVVKSEVFEEPQSSIEFINQSDNIIPPGRSILTSRLGSSSLSGDRTNLEFVAGHEDSVVVKSEVFQKPQSIKFANQPDNAIPPGTSIFAPLTCTAIPNISQDQKCCFEFGLGEEYIAEMPSNRLPPVQKIDADETINPSDSFDGNSIESNHINEACNEFDDPVGTFGGGEFNNSKSNSFESQAENLKPFDNSSLTRDRNNLEFVSDHEDEVFVKSEVFEEPQSIEFVNQPDNIIPPGVSTLTSTASSVDHNCVEFGPDEQFKAEIPSNRLAIVQEIDADVIENTPGSFSEISNESIHIKEDYDDPVGTFSGGEFNNSRLESTQSQSKDRSSQSESCGSDSYSSEDEIPLALSIKGQSNAEDQQKGNSTTKHDGNSLSYSQQRPSKGINKRRYETALGFDVSDTEKSEDTDFRHSDGYSYLKAKDNVENKSKGNSANIPQHQNARETNQADTNIRKKFKSSYSYTPNESSNNKITHKTALEFDESEVESAASNEGASHSDSQNKSKPRYRKFTYLANLKRPKTTQEYDEFIAKWRPNLECLVCQATCSTYSLLLQHFKHQHPTEECYISCCQVKFHHRYEIEKHIHYHNEHTAFKCEICFKCYTLPTSLRDHLLKKHTVNSTDRTFQCPQCSSSFRDSRALERHLKGHCDKGEKKKDRIHSCNECGRSYKSIIYLKNHYRAEHTGKEREIIKCNVCDKVYKNRDDLQDHMDKHRGERNRVCLWCPNAYSLRSALLIHCKRDHPKELEESRKQQEEQRKIVTSLKCDNCDKVYQTRLAFLEHQASHNGKALYRCKYCPKEYKYSSSLAAHVKRVHPNNVQEKRGRQKGYKVKK